MAMAMPLEQSSTQWNCSNCTYENPASSDTCIMCNLPALDDSNKVLPASDAMSIDESPAPNDHETKQVDEDDDDDWGSDDGDEDGWDGDGNDLLDPDDTMAVAINHDDFDDSEAMLRRAMEKRRIEQSDVSKFWKCGACEFLNHPSRATCLCGQPKLEIVRGILNGSDNKTCPHCGSIILNDEFEDHMTDCRPTTVSDTGVAIQWYVDLTECEKNAVVHVLNDSAERSDLALPVLEQRFASMGRSQEDLNTLLQFMEWRVPVIIHVDPVKYLHYLIKDTNYRNTFETNTGTDANNHSARAGWETRMFGTCYDAAKPVERPKYGCLNVGLQPSGCQQATSYGDSWFELKNETVRWRTTVTSSDSASDVPCGTLGKCCHVLQSLGDPELQELCEAAIQNKRGGQQQSGYREVQLHGPIVLNRDISSFNVPRRHQSNQSIRRQCEQFCEMNGCELKWF